MYSQIDSVMFGVLSSNEISRNAVCVVENTELSGPGSVYDERMGVVENGKTCLTCGQTNKTCPGHYGCIKFAAPIYNPMFHKHIVACLNMFCAQCSRLIVSGEHLELAGTERTLQGVAAHVSSVKECYYCACKKHKCAYIASETQIVRTVNKTKTVVDPVECLAIFNLVLDDDVRLLGVDPVQMHPRNMVMEYMIVLPVRARPYIISDGNMCDDDLTVVYQQIVRINTDFSSDKMAALVFQVSTFMNNSDGRSTHNNGGRAIKGIKERISGKGGIIRNNMSGKRVNQSARTVIGPDTTLRTNEVAVPEQIAAKLTVSEYVNDINIGAMQELVDTGGANFVLRDNVKINLKYACTLRGTPLLPDDKVFRDGVEACDRPVAGDMLMRDGEMVAYVPPTTRQFSVRVGDTIERKLVDGDVVLINRQPTLHKCSMLAKRVVVRKGKTLRLNLATTKVFNADFDGDEMNIHVPQDPVTRTELAVLSLTDANIISAQTSAPHISVVQDGLLGAYLMTTNEAVLPHSVFSNTLMHLSAPMERVQQVTDVLGTSGRALVSLTLPNTFNMHTTDASVSDGMLVRGHVTKSLMSKIMRTLHHDYGTVFPFIDEIQFVANMWLEHFGFSIGIADCLPTEALTQNVDNIVAKYLSEAAIAGDTSVDPRIKEVKVARALAKAKDAGMRAAKLALGDTNGFRSTVTSGSKGDYFNVCQITGLLGQQSVGGARVKPTLNNGTRTLPHYPMDQGSDNFEARGFVRSTFVRGLKPHEMFFHSMCGREGVSDTALKTAVSGYTQRKMVKILEDIQVMYDGTVRNSTGDIIQWEYSGDGLDRTRTIPSGSTVPDFCDISRLADNLNRAFDKSI